MLRSWSNARSQGPSCEVGEGAAAADKEVSISDSDGGGGGPSRGASGDEGGTLEGSGGGVGVSSVTPVDADTARRSAAARRVIAGGTPPSLAATPGSATPGLAPSAWQGLTLVHLPGQPSPILSLTPCNQPAHPTQSAYGEPDKRGGVYGPGSWQPAAYATAHERANEARMLTAVAAELELMRDEWRASPAHNETLRVAAHLWRQFRGDRALVVHPEYLRKIDARRQGRTQVRSYFLQLDSSLFGVIGYYGVMDKWLDLREEF